MSQARQTQLLESLAAVGASTIAKPAVVSAGEGMVANVSVFWRPLVAGGYYLNA